MWSDKETTEEIYKKIMDKINNKEEELEEANGISEDEDF